MLYLKPAYKGLGAIDFEVLPRVRLRADTPAEFRDAVRTVGPWLAVGLAVTGVVLVAATQPRS